MNTETQRVPAVTQVAIMGEVIVGGTVEGSYLYQESGGEQGESKYFWRIGSAEGDVVSNDVYLDLLQKYSGEILFFSVVPVSAGGEEGIEAFAEPKLIAAQGYQNITNEESESSYLKQRGQFSFHGLQPQDRIFSATAGAFALKSRTTQSVTMRGGAQFGADVPQPIRNYLLNNPAITIFSILNSFGALVPVGGRNQLMLWGPGIPATLPDLSNVRSVYSNQGAFAFIYDNPGAGNNTIEAVGPATSGGVVPADIQTKLLFDKPRAIYATLNAFAVLTETGKVYAWGAGANGGTIPADIDNTLKTMTIKRIICSQTAFCAIDEDGYLIGWGTNGILPVDALERIYNDGGVGTVVGNEGAFCAITQGNRRAVTWGSATYGGTLTGNAALLAARGNISLLASTPWAMAFVNENGQFAAWGQPSYGGTLPTSKAQELEELFKKYPISKGWDTVLKRVSSRVKLADNGTAELISNDASFVIIIRDAEGWTRGIEVWGLAGSGGAILPATRQVLEASRIHRIYRTNGAYAAITEQGSATGAVVTWGKTASDGGEIPASLSDALRRGVIEIYSIQSLPYPPSSSASAFAARKENNTCPTWGGHVPTEIVDLGDEPFPVEIKP